MNRAQILGLSTVCLPALALAHASVGATDSFGSGFLHPLTGVDHFLAMLAVGMWGALLGGRLLWMLPVAFPLMMAVGAIFGIAGFRLPGVEPAIIASVIALGMVIALKYRASLPIAVGLVAIFAFCHGYAHGVELPRREDAALYCAGFIVATGLIHMAGIAIGTIAAFPRGLEVLRGVGAAIALSGFFLAAQHFVQ